MVWESVYKPKNNGVLGIREIRVFNEDLMEKTTYNSMLDKKILDGDHKKNLIHHGSLLVFLGNLISTFGFNHLEKNCGYKISS